MVALLERSVPLGTVFYILTLETVMKIPLALRICCSPMSHRQHSRPLLVSSAGGLWLRWICEPVHSRRSREASVCVCRQPRGWKCTLRGLCCCWCRLRGLFLSLGSHRFVSSLFLFCSHAHQVRRCTAPAGHALCAGTAEGGRSDRTADCACVGLTRRRTHSRCRVLAAVCAVWRGRIRNLGYV